MEYVAEGESRSVLDGIESKYWAKKRVAFEISRFFPIIENSSREGCNSNDGLKQIFVKVFKENSSKSFFGGVE